MTSITFPNDFPSCDKMISTLKVTFEKSWRIPMDIEDVENWLNNFSGEFYSKEDERRIALWLLCNFTYYGDIEINHLCAVLFHNLMHKLAVDMNLTCALDVDNVLKKTVFTSIGSASESGGLMLYHFRQDVSCIHTPEMFTLLKYFELSNPKPSIDIAYSIPFDYEFQNEPFTSYHSYYGDLRTNDLLGYGGNLDGSAYSKMIIFLGFEGALSSKVAEDIQYDDLLLVNNLPSFFPKYRDISIINNYDLLTGQHGKYLYVPASNPFETYNFLCRTLQESEHVCIGLPFLR